MKLAFLIHDKEAPSCRYRVLQYIPYLKGHGVDVSVRLFRGNLLDRYRFYESLRQYDLLLIQRKLVHPVDFWYIRRKARKIIYDFDDALMYRSAKSKNPYSMSRRAKFAYLVKRADLVIAGNAFLKSEALRHNDHVVTIPTPLDLSRYRLKEGVPNKDVVTIGWLGSRSSLRYLRSLLPTLESIFRKHPEVRLKIVCSEFLDSRNLPIVKKQWSWEDEEEDLRSFDIGVMPLSNDLWSKGKCGLKILQYYSVGVPVVCTPVGINQDIVTHGVNGFWALNEGQWEEGLVTLIQNQALRREMGLRGRETVEKTYSLEANAPRLFEVLKEVVDQG